jgi:hypothetical protein
LGNNKENYDFLYFVSKRKGNGKTILNPYDKCPLTFINKEQNYLVEHYTRFQWELEQREPERNEISTHRTFSEDVLEKIINHPLLRVKLLTQ